MLAGQNSKDSGALAEYRVDWRRGSLTLADPIVTMRELELRDAPSLLEQVSHPGVLRYISASPRSLDGFERFIRWTRMQRRLGTHICFGIVPAGQTSPVGVLQIWPIEPDFSTAEWGFVIGESSWGTGVFGAAAHLALDFAFCTLAVQRLEARAVAANDRGNAVLRKLGATREGILRRSFRSDTGFLDHVMWSILADEYLERRAMEPLHTLEPLRR